MPGGFAAKVSLPVWARVMKQEQGLYAMNDFPIPDGLEAVDVGGGLFGQGERYYLTPDQRGLLAQDTSGSDDSDTGSSGVGGVIQRFFNSLFH
jgi:hypothetical protein